MRLVPQSFSLRIAGLLFFSSTLTPIASCEQPLELCLDRFCIGQTIQDPQFDAVDWIVPAKGLIKESCKGVGCQPEVAFRGYKSDEQARLAQALSWKYGLNSYNVVTKGNLGTLRLYKYECNASARGIWGERRFFGAYLSAPSKYLTVVGLRLIKDELTVYRIARQYPYRNQDELVSLASELNLKYGKRLLLYNYLSSNAYSHVIEEGKDGWFARSTMFDPTDLSDNAAELVLIDPSTRSLLQPNAMPDSGEIKPLAARLPPQCSRALPLQ